MRTIDADLFKNNVKAWTENIRDFRSDNKCFFTEENILKAIDDQPTVDTEPIRYGVWEHCYEENVAICSICKEEHYLGTYHQYARNYCSNCGARMKDR